MASFIEIHLKVTELCEKSYYFWIAPRICCVDDSQIISNCESRHSIIEEEGKGIISTSHILSFACVCTSLFCLLVTFVTYAVTPEMRIQAGINNVILCVSILFAQTAKYYSGLQLM